MKVHDLMTLDPIACSQDDDLMSAGKMMREGGCGSLPVSGASGKLVGFLTDRDICNYLVETDCRASNASVGDAMHPGVWCCQPDDTAAEALAIMRHHHVRRLPVLDKSEGLVGIVSLDDIAVAASVEATMTFEGPTEADLAGTVRAVGHARPRR